MAANYMARDISKAGQTASVGGYTVTYDADGYAVSAKRNKAGGTTVVDGVTVTGQASSGRTAASTDSKGKPLAYDPNTDYHAQAVAAAQAGDWAAVNTALAYRQAKVNDQGGNDRGITNAQILAELKQQYGSTGTTGSSAASPASSSASSASGYTPQASYVNTSYTPATYTPAAYVEPEKVDLSAEKEAARRSAASQKLDHVDTGSFKAYLHQWLSSARQQAEGTVDRATEQGVAALERAKEDTEPRFQAQHNQINLDEALAKDNQALYAQARGDRGGIGAAQYDSIMNTAAKNRQTVEAARTKLATDTARQIADLRANGEYEKADAVLNLTQQYLSQLTSIEQWGVQTNLSIDQFNAQVEQWLANYVSQLTQIEQSGNQWERQFALSQQQYADQQVQAALQWDLQQRQYQDELAKYADSRDQWERQFAAAQQQYADLASLQRQQYADQQAQRQEEWAQTLQQYAGQQAESRRKVLSGAGEALLSVGLLPSSEQLEAMGMTEDEARKYLSAVQAATAAQAARTSKSGSGGTGGSSGNRSGSSGSDTGIVETMLNYGNDALAYEYLTRQGYTNAKTETFWNLYQEARKAAASSAGGVSNGYVSQADLTRQSYTGSTTNSGMNEAYFRQASSSIMTLLNQGDVKNALSGVDRIWNRLNASQKKELQNALSKFGIAYQPDLGGMLMEDHSCPVASSKTGRALPRSLWALARAVAGPGPPSPADRPGGRGERGPVAHPRPPGADGRKGVHTIPGGAGRRCPKKPCGFPGNQV